jgi:hypothetical protein
MFSLRKREIAGCWLKGTLIDSAVRSSTNRSRSGGRRVLLLRYRMKELVRSG